MEKNNNTPVEDYGRKKGIRLESLAIVDSMSVEGGVVFRN